MPDYENIPLDTFAAILESTLYLSHRGYANSEGRRIKPLWQVIDADGRIYGQAPTVSETITKAHEEWTRRQQSRRMTIRRERETRRLGIAEPLASIIDPASRETP